MKAKLLMIVGIVLLFGVSLEAQVMTACLTMEESQAQYNRNKANSIVVTSTATQQLQCYHQQLATYWQQKHKDNQQIAKDLQQLAKDKQQMEKDAQQIATDKVLAERAACLATQNTGYDEVVSFIEVILPYVGDCSVQLRNELKAIHYNRSGHADGTNPGGQTHNIRGFDNPAWVIAR